MLVKTQRNPGHLIMAQESLSLFLDDLVKASRREEKRSQLQAWDPSEALPMIR